MRNVKRSALVTYSARQMFRLVDDIESYPQFLPWCSDARIEQSDGSAVEATLELRKGGITRSFTTRNERQPFEAIELHLLNGPFKHLHGAWEFRDLGEQGSKVSLAIEFEFESSLVDVMLGAFFESTCNSLVDAFTARAAAIYGQQA